MKYSEYRAQKAKECWDEGVKNSPREAIGLLNLGGYVALLGFWYTIWGLQKSYVELNVDVRTKFLNFTSDNFNDLAQRNGKTPEQFRSDLESGLSTLELDLQQAKKNHTFTECSKGTVNSLIILNMSALLIAPLLNAGIKFEDDKWSFYEPFTPTVKLIKNISNFYSVPVVYSWHKACQLTDSIFEKLGIFGEMPPAAKIHSEEKIEISPKRQEKVTTSKNSDDIVANEEKQKDIAELPSIVERFNIVSSGSFDQESEILIGEETEDPAT